MSLIEPGLRAAPHCGGDRERYEQRAERARGAEQFARVSTAEGRARRRPRDEGPHGETAIDGPRDPRGRRDSAVDDPCATEAAGNARMRGH